MISSATAMIVRNKNTVISIVYSINNIVIIDVNHA